MRIEVLDHGYVSRVETWGSDERIVESARMSTNKGFQGWGEFVTCTRCKGRGKVWVDFDRQCCSDIFDPCPECNGQKGKGTHGDEKLLRYLYEHSHFSPFEMCGMTIEVQAPIFVIREWQRHRTQSFSELSSRYTEMPELFYVPSEDRLRNGGQSKTNKQASGARAHYCISDVQNMIGGLAQQAFGEYRQMLDMGVARELARLVLPVNTYSRMRASANLRNWMAFLTLRLDAAAQWEIRQYAEAVAEMVKDAFPRTYGLFAEGRAA